MSGAHVAWIHRAVTEAVVHGIVTKAADDLTLVFVSLGSITPIPDADLAIVVDPSGLPDDDLDASLARVASAIGPDGAIALVASSPSAAPLVSVAQTAMLGASGTFGFATAWANQRRRVVAAPGLSHDRLHAVTAAAARAGLALVVPDVAVVAPALARVRLPRTATARATLLLVARGALAMPIFFVAAARAPKGGIPKTKIDRVADGWVGAGAAVAAIAASRPPSLTSAALGVLAASTSPLPFRDLLRRARELHGAASSDDAKKLAAALFRLSGSDVVELFARDPQRHLPLAS